MSSTIPQPLSGADMILENVGRKMTTGRQLTFADENMAMVASGTKSAESYGPGPAEMEVSRPELPENIKGVLVEHAT